MFLFDILVIFSLIVVIKLHYLFRQNDFRLADSTILMRHDIESKNSNWMYIHNIQDTTDISTRPVNSKTVVLSGHIPVRVCNLLNVLR